MVCNIRRGNIRSMGIVSAGIDLVALEVVDTATVVWWSLGTENLRARHFF